MRSSIIILSLIIIFGITGCNNKKADNKEIIGGADAPTTIVLESNDDSDNTPAITGTWVTASMGYEYFGTSQPEYYVQFSDSEINYLHMKEEELVIDHSNKIVSIEETSPGIYIIQAETANGGQYSYKTDENDVDQLNYYSTWDKADFPNTYSGGSSLSRIDEKE